VRPVSVSFYVGDADYLNVSNDNFIRLMELLDVAVDRSRGLCGEFEGPALWDLRVKVVFALDSLRALPALDGGVAPVDVSGGGGGCRVIDMGLSPGYFAHRLTRLLTAIDAALACGVPLRYD
jgi:hypothetical protein